MSEEQDFFIIMNSMEYGFGPELFTTNAGFEIGGTGGNFNGGTEADDGTSDNFTEWIEQGVSDVDGDKVEATVTKHAGTYAVKISKAVAASVGVQSPLGGITVTPGGLYKLSFYTRGDGSVGGYYYIYDRTGGAYIVNITATGITGTDYTEKVVFFTAPAGCIAADINLRVLGVGTVYFDAVSVKQYL